MTTLSKQLNRKQYSNSVSVFRASALRRPSNDQCSVTVLAEVKDGEEPKEEMRGRKRSMGTG